MTRAALSLWRISVLAAVLSFWAVLAFAAEPKTFHDTGCYGYDIPRTIIITRPVIIHLVDDAAALDPFNRDLDGFTLTESGPWAQVFISTNRLVCLAHEMAHTGGWEHGTH